MLRLLTGGFEIRREHGSCTTHRLRSQPPACIKVSFSGSYEGHPNGPRVPNSKDGPAYGSGFSVEISGLSGNVAIRSVPEHPKPKNTWLVEQWVADFNFRNGEVVRQDAIAQMDKGGQAFPEPKRVGDTVSWWDHPGTIGTASRVTTLNGTSTSRLITVTAL